MNRMSELFNFGAEQKVVQMLPGITRKALAYSETMIACELRMEKGSVVPLHQHVHEQCSMVISGRLRYTVGNETRIVESGDTVMLPSNMPHSIIVEEETLAIDVFTPLREEYI